MMVLLDHGPGALTLGELRRALAEPAMPKLEAGDWAAIDASRAAIERVLESGATAYGVNTGFGLLADTAIPPEDLAALQRNLVLSHAAGLGPLLEDEVVRLILTLKIASLARGHSGVRREVIEALRALLDAEVYPCVPAKGSVGASGDLAPLAHLSAALLGVGEVRHRGKAIPAEEGLRIAGIAPVELAAKEGLALLNGTQISTALALHGLFAIENVFAAGLVSGALSTDALSGSVRPFDARIHAARGQAGQIAVAAALRRLMEGSAILDAHRTCGKVQDPYSLRCQPQVMGACLDSMRHAARVLEIEANAVTDNPLLFVEGDDPDVISGGNFHAEPVAMASDLLAIAVAEIASIAERRIALLVDPKMSNLPPFLVLNSGLNSGFMIAQVTAAALVSENKTLAHPASVDSIPTSANQEDHVSMATFGARRLGEMARNAAGVIAVELLAAAQGIDFHAPDATSPALGEAMAMIRERVGHYGEDRFMAPDMAAVTEMVLAGAFNRFAAELLPSGGAA